MKGSSRRLRKYPEPPARSVLDHLMAEQWQFKGCGALSMTYKADITNDSNKFWLVPTSSKQFKLPPTGLNCFRPVKTGSDQLQAIPTGSDQFKPVQTCSDQFWAVPTSSHCFRVGLNQLEPFCTSLNRLELVWTGWNQLELVGTVLYLFYPVATSQHWLELAWTNRNQSHHYPQESDGENPPGNLFQRHKGWDDCEAPTLMCVWGITLSHHPQCWWVRGERFVLCPHLGRAVCPCSS